MTVMRGRGLMPRRLAMVTVHTSPLDQPGTGDAGGMNVYVVELSRRLAALGVEVDLITRATSSDLPPAVELTPGVTVRHVTAGPFEGLAKEDLPAQLCAFTSGLMRLEAARPPGLRLFVPLGIALEDVAVAAEINRRASEAGLGRELPL